MNGNNWLLLMAGLVLAAMMSFAAMRRMSAPLPKYVSGEILNMERSDSGKTAAADKSVVPATAGRTEHIYYDALWQKSLFNDVRSEGENGAVGGTAAAEGRVMGNSEFEVVGLVRIGKKDSAVPVAIITQVQGGRNTADTRNRSSSRMFSRRNIGRQPEPAAQEVKEDRKVDRNIYRTGDTIGQTGYVVKEIVMEENKVVIARAGSELELFLDVANTNSSVRRENVQRDALQVRDRYAAQRQEEARQAKEKADQIKRRAELEERVKNFARARGQNISKDELNRRVQMMERFEQQRRQAQQAQQAQQARLQQQQQQQQQNNQPQNQNVSGQRGSASPPAPPGNSGNAPGGRTSRFRNMSGGNR